MFRHLIKTASRIDSAALWAFTATTSAASSTVLYILISHSTEWAANFIQLYSIVGLLSGWSNALIYFFSPHSTKAQSKLSGFLFYITSILIVLGLYSALFNQEIGLGEVSFTAGLLIPLLFANSFGLEFSEGNFPWVYKRVIIYNLFLFTSALPSIFSTHPKDALFISTGIVAILFFFFWIFDKHRKIMNKKISIFSVQAWLNPAVPILERSVWDQWILSSFNFTILSTWIYLAGRVLGFVGNITYSFFLGRSANLFVKKQKQNKQILLIFLLMIFSIVIASLFFQYTAVLVGQLFSLLLGISMTVYFRDKKKMNYMFFLLAWAFDFLCRLLIFTFANDIHKYFEIILVISTIEIVFLLFLFLLRSKLRQEKPSTKLLPEDALGKH